MLSIEDNAGQSFRSRSRGFIIDKKKKEGGVFTKQIFKREGKRWTKGRNCSCHKTCGIKKAEKETTQEIRAAGMTATRPVEVEWAESKSKKRDLNFLNSSALLLERRSLR